MGLLNTKRNKGNGQELPKIEGERKSQFCRERGGGGGHILRTNGRIATLNSALEIFGSGLLNALVAKEIGWELEEGRGNKGGSPGVYVDGFIAVAILA